MKEIKILGSLKKDGDNKKYIYAVFECPICGKYVEKKLHHGRKVKSCSKECYKYGAQQNIFRRKCSKPLEYIIDDNGCFVVTSHGIQRGYTHVFVNGKTIRSHRLIYEECFGPIQKGMIVRHKCDNRTCINPEHLELGSHLDNMKDMVERGRSRKGSKNNSSKLTEEQVVQIKKLKGKKTLKEIGDLFNVDMSNISKIFLEKTWSHVTINDDVNEKRNA